jgi:glycosyltransferase involved in cell wall biosynthesis
VSSILLVTQQARGYGEFRKPWVRALYRRYVERYRHRVARIAAALAPGHAVTILADRGLVDDTRLPAGVRVRYYDEESFEDSKELWRRNQRLLASLWPSRAAAPELRYRGVWLPDLLTLVRGIVLHLEVTEPVGIAEEALTQTRPERVILVSGASVLERATRLIAEGKGVPVRVAAPWFLAARAYARFWRRLQIRDDKLRARELLDFPRRPPETARSPAPRILFVTCRPRHHFVVDPLVEAVRAAGIEPHVIAAPVHDPELGARLDGLARLGIAAEYLANYLPPREARALARRYRPRFRRLWRRIAGSPEFARAQAEDPLCHTLARPLLRDTVRRSLLVPLLIQEAAWRALDHLRPSAVVITSNRRWTERALALAAREKGIPVLMFSGTLLMGRDPYEFLDVADRLLVIGDHLREGIIRDQGVKPDRITVVGDPRSNAARLVSPAELRREVARRFQLTTERPIIVFISKYVSRFFSDHEKEAFYRTFIASVRELGGLQVIVKVHPNEELSVLRHQVEAWGWPDAVLTKDYDIHRLFGAADAAVMVTSMAGIEAMALGCPVVAVQAATKNYEGDAMPPYVTESVVERVDMGDSGALAMALSRLLSDSDHRQVLVERGRKFAARYVHPVDGGLAERLLAVVDEVGRERADRRTP